MPKNNKPKSKSSFVVNIKLIGEGFSNTFKEVVGSAKQLNDTLNDVARKASDVYDDNLFQEIDQAVSNFEDSKNKNQKEWERVEANLGSIDVFPNLRKNIDKSFSFAESRLNIAKKARMNSIIDSQDLSEISANVDSVKDAALAVDEAALDLAKLQASANLEDVETQKQISLARSKLEKNEDLLKSATERLKKSTDFTVASQIALDELSDKMISSGTSSFFETFSEGLNDFRSGFASIFSMDTEEGKKRLLKAIGKGKAIREKRREVLSSDSDNSLGALDKSLMLASSVFSSMTSGVARLALGASTAIAAVGGFITAIQFLIMMSDKARQLNKDLLDSRSLGELGLKLNAVQDEQSVKEFLDSLRGVYQYQFDSENPFILSKDEFMESRAAFKDLNLARAAGPLASMEERQRVLNNFAQMGIVARREWADQGGALSQLAIDLVNEYGASSRYTETIAGGLDRIAKGTTLSVPRLLGAVQGLSDQSPIFGDNVIASASLFAKLYTTGILGTKDIRSYLEMLVGTFQSEDTAQRIAGFFATNKPDEAIKVLEMAIASIDPNGPKARYRQLLQEGVDKFRAVAKKGGAVTAQDSLELATVLQELVKSTPQAAQALLGLSLLSEGFLNAKASDKDFNEKTALTQEMISKFQVYTGDSEAAAKFKLALIALAKDDKNKNKTIRELIYESLSGIKEQADSDAAAYDAIKARQKRNASAFADAGQGLVNSIQSFMMTISNVANDLVTGIQNFLATPVMRKLAELIGFTLPKTTSNLLPESVPISVQPSLELNEIISRLARLRDEMRKTKGKKDPETVKKFHEALGQLATVSQKYPDQAEYALRGQSLGFTEAEAEGVNVKEALPDSPAGTVQAIQNFIKAPPPHRPEPEVPAVRLSGEKLSEKIKQSLSMDSFKMGNVTVKIPKEFAQLSEKQHSILDNLLKNQNDPRYLILQALQMRYGNTPVFAYLLKKMLAKMESEPSISPEDLASDVLHTVRGTVSGSYFPDVIKNFKDNGVQVSAYFQDIVRKNIGPFREQVNGIQKKVRATNTAASRSSKAPATKGKSEEPKSKVPAPPVLPPPAPAKNIQQPPTPAPPDPSLKTVTAEIQYKVKNIKMKIYQTKIDVAAIANRAISDRLTALSQREEQTRAEKQ